jgi:hypothetical protein
VLAGADAAFFAGAADGPGPTLNWATTRPLPSAREPNSARLRGETLKCFICI